MRIIFLGSPEFAVPSLQKLIEGKYNIVAVITSTDKVGGRGQSKLIESDVKKFALSQNIPVLQPRNLKDQDFLEQLRSYRADIQVVVAFRMLPEVVWNMPPLGTMNLHASLLPKYRGAAPINWAIINGEVETGVTTFRLKHEIDTGDILLQSKTAIGEGETAGDLYDRLKVMGADLVLETVRKLENNTLQPIPQSTVDISKAPKIFHHDCRIRFHKTTANVYNFIRGLSPYPTAWTILDDKKLKIFSCTKEIKPPRHEPGKWLTDNKFYLKTATLDGYISVEDLQLEGKKRMDIRAFLNGYKINL